MGCAATGTEDAWLFRRKSRIAEICGWKFSTTAGNPDVPESTLCRDSGSHRIGITRDGQRMMSAMYSVVLSIHSWMRWLTLILAVAATLNAIRPPLAGASRLPGRWWDTFFMLAVDLQVFFGLVLYFGLSPFTKEAMTNVGAAMRTPALRFWAIEHAGGMFAAVVLIRMGRVLAANASSRLAARNRRLTCFAIATVGMLLSIPWPGLTNGRPLFRL